jgi:dTDP-4-dehydrorhamnose reductase
MTKILVTGSNGQLGSELKWLEKDFPQLSFKFYDSKSWDITSEEATARLLHEENPEVIINCAAYTAVDKAEEEQELATEVNDRAVKNLADASQERGIFLIHFSTDYVFDGKAKTPYSEDDQTNPLSVYGKTKLAGENHVLNTDKGLVLRVSWLFSTFGKNFLKTMIKLGSERDKLSVVNDQIASPTYARILAMDLLNTVADWSEDKTKPYGLYHYSHDGLASWFDFAQHIFDLMDIQVELTAVSSEEFKTAAVRPHFSKLNSGVWLEKSGLNSIGWKEAVSKCVENLKNEIE